MSFLNFDAGQAIHYLVQMAIAYLLALPVGLNRELNNESAGIRTFPLVAVGACGYMLVGLSAMQDDNALSRVVYGITTGIGFIGGGSILKSKGMVTGTATAASIWNMGAIGIAVAWNRLEIAVVLCVLNLFTLYLLHPFKKIIDKKRDEKEQRQGRLPEEK